MQPTDYNSPATPLVFYREDTPGGGVLRYDDRVSVRRVVQGVGANSNADLLIDWQGEYWRDGKAVRNGLTEGGLRVNYPPTLRCAVGTVPPPGGSEEDIVFVAHGYLDAEGLKIGAAGDQAFNRRTRNLRDIFQRVARSQRAQIQGRWMLALTLADEIRQLVGPPAAIIDKPWDANSFYLTRALPCIFNYKGKPNRLKTPVYYKTGNQWHAGPIHLFTYEGDPDAEYWTVMQALRYLVLLYIPEGLDAAVDPSSLFLDHSGPQGDPYWKMFEGDLPADPNRSPTSFADLTVRNMPPTDLDGKNILEALTLIGAMAGFRWHVEHRNEVASGNGLRVLSNLKFWGPGDATPEAMGLEKNGAVVEANGKAREAEDFFDANNLKDSNLQLDYGSVVSRVEVIGGLLREVVTSELKPMWKPDARWDDVSASDRTTFNTDSSSDKFTLNPESEFYKRFHPKGDLFRTGENEIVGRMWGLDPAGLLAPNDYDRTSGPFTDYSKLWTLPSAAGIEVRRKRKMLGVQTIQDGKPPIGVVLEISFDGGQVWWRLETQFKVFANDTAIYLRAQNLLGIGRKILEPLQELGGPPTPPDNYYDAYMGELLRLRATFQTETDDRIEATAETTQSPLSSQGLTKLVLRERGAGEVEMRTTFDDHAVSDAVIDRVLESDNTYTLQHLANVMLAVRSAAKWVGNPVVPWIEETRYPLGTPLEGIRRAVSGPVEIEFGGSLDRKSGYPVVIQKTYNVSDQTTELLLRH